MVEAGEDAVAVVGLELGIDVLFLIGVDETDAAAAVVVVLALVVHS